MKRTIQMIWWQCIRRYSSGQRGFSLLELMVAVVIVAMMVGLITPQMMKASAKAEETACQGNVKTISAALAEYNLLNQSLPTGDANAQIQTLVSSGLLSSAALSGSYTIDDSDPNQISVACQSVSGVSSNATS